MVKGRLPLDVNQSSSAPRTGLFKDQGHSPQVASHSDGGGEVLQLFKRHWEFCMPKEWLQFSVRVLVLHVEFISFHFLSNIDMPPGPEFLFKQKIQKWHSVKN